MENKFLSEISFFCPAYNDEKNLPDLIPTVHKFLVGIADKFEIIIVEDGSPDRTGEVADKLASDFSNVRVIHHSRNLGYGATLKDGFANARYDYIMYTDGDFQYDVNDFKPFLKLLPEADVLSGYAVKKAVNFQRKVQSGIFNFLVNILFLVNFKDVNCSMKIYKREVLKAIDIKSGSAFIDAEMLIGAKSKGFKVVQFPVTHYERRSGIASGSKLNVIVATIKDMIRFRLGIL